MEMKFKLNGVNFEQNFIYPVIPYVYEIMVKLQRVEFRPLNRLPAAIFLTEGFFTMFPNGNSRRITVNAVVNPSPKLPNFSWGLASAPQTPSCDRPALEIW